MIVGDLVHILSVRLYICKWYLLDALCNPMHLRWCTKREWPSNPFIFISKCQRWSSFNGGFTSRCSDSSWGTISSSSASSCSFPHLWTSRATLCNSASLRSPFCARRYRNKTCVMNMSLWLTLKDEPNTKLCLVKLECYQKHQECIILSNNHYALLYRNSRNMQTNIRTPITSTQTTNLWNTRYFQPVLFLGKIAVVTSFTAQI